MGDSIRISGSLQYSDAEQLQLAFDAGCRRIEEAVATHGASMITPSDLVTDGMWIVVEVSGFCPASSSFEAEGVVRTLAERAIRGFVDFEFGEGERFSISAKKV